MSQQRPESDLDRTKRFQRDAADPRASVWVSANAGTGKTHVLTMRLLRILLAGTPPERILALTYTKAAAAEMSKRVFARLAQWVTAPDDALTGRLAELLGRAPTPEEMQRARQLFAIAIETPGGLKVQTIHAFCERLLQRFPLEAGVPPGFTVLDEAHALTLMRDGRQYRERDIVERPLQKLHHRQVEPRPHDINAVSGKPDLRDDHEVQHPRTGEIDQPLGQNRGAEARHLDESAQIHLQARQPFGAGPDPHHVDGQRDIHLHDKGPHPQPQRCCRNRR